MDTKKQKNYSDLNETLNEQQDDSDTTQTDTQSDALKFKMKVYKWLQILFVTLITLGPFICSYGISSVKEGYKSLFSLSDLQYNSMQSSITFVACVFSLFCGFITDKIGIRKALVCFSLLCTVGYTIQFFGVYLKIFYLSCIGQGLGYVNLNGLCILQGPLISRWVDKKEYGFCLSITFLSVRFADVISSWTYPPIFENSGNLYLSFLFGVIMLGSTLLIGVANSYYLDRKAEKKGLIQHATISDINFEHIKKLNINYWIVVLIGVLGLSSFYAYYFNSQTILKKFYNIDGITAGRLFSIPFFVTFVSPVFGFLLDRMKNKGFFLICSSLSIVLGYLYWLIFYDCQQDECYKTVVPAYVMLGLFLSTFTNTVWYCVFLTTSVKISGSAYGILVSFKNLGIALSGMVEGSIMDTKSTFWAIMFPFIISVVCLIVSIGLYVKNAKQQFLTFEFKTQLDLPLAEENASQIEESIYKNESNTSEITINENSNKES